MALSTREKTEPVTRWLSISRASQLLGINQATLRRWADQGEVRNFRTPGGHRRFAEEDLSTLMRSDVSGEPRHTLDALGEVTLSRIRRRLQQLRLHSSHWHQALDEAGREHMRLLGGRLVTVAADYMTHPRSRASLLEEARRIGEGYGTEAARCGLPLRELLAAFFFFRSSLDEMVKRFAQGDGVTAHQIVELWLRVANLMDEVLLATTEAYEKARQILTESGWRPTNS